MRGLSSLYGLGVLRPLRCSCLCLEKSDKQPCKKTDSRENKNKTLKMIEL